jgi:hypothetical protein
VLGGRIEFGYGYGFIVYFVVVCIPRLLHVGSLSLEAEVEKGLHGWRFLDLVAYTAWVWDMLFSRQHCDACPGVYIDSSWNTEMF